MKSGRRWRGLSGRKTNFENVYIDLGNFPVDFLYGILQIIDSQRVEYEGRCNEVPGIFSLMDPLEGAIKAFHRLSAKSLATPLA